MGASLGRAIGKIAADLADGITAAQSAANLEVQDLRKPKSGRPALALGGVEGLELFWDGPTVAKPSEPLITSEGDIRVQIAETFIQTTAVLTLKSMRGRVAEWKLAVPAGAEVNVAGIGPETGFTAIPTNDDKSEWVIRGREGAGESLTVEIAVHSPRKNGGTPIGPFTVLGAFRQQGTIQILSPTNLRPRFTRKRDDVTRRDLPADTAAPADAKAEYLQAVFSYAQPARATTIGPLLQVDAESVRGEVRTSVSHVLTLTELGWRLVTDIKATPIRTELETLEVEIPTELQGNLQASPPELVEKLERPDPSTNRYIIRLAHPRRVETTVRLESIWSKALGVADSKGSPGSQRVAVVLPRMVGTFDRDGKVSATIPDGMELRGAVHEWEGGRPSEWSRSFEEQSSKPPSLGVATARPVARVDLSWRPLSALVPVHSTIDLTIEERQALVVQRISLPKAAAGGQITLRASEEHVPTQVRAIEGGEVVQSGPREWTLTLRTSPDRDATAVLAYLGEIDFGKPEIGQRLELRLLSPVTEAACETRLRVWMRTPGLGVRPVLDEGPWAELPPAPIPDHNSLPALVLHGSGTALPLALRFERAAGLTPAGLVIERALDSGPRRGQSTNLCRSISSATGDGPGRRDRTSGTADSRQLAGNQIGRPPYRESANR